MSEGAITSHPIRMAVRRPRGPVGPKEGRGDRSPPCGSKVRCLPPLPRATWTRWCQALLFSKRITSSKTLDGEIVTEYSILLCEGRLRVGIIWVTVYVYVWRAARGGAREFGRDREGSQRGVMLRCWCQMRCLTWVLSILRSQRESAQMVARTRVDKLDCHTKPQNPQAFHLSDTLTYNISRRSAHTYPSKIE